MRTIIAGILFFFIQLPVIDVACQPPDNPLRPGEWIQQMGSGNWLIFNIPPDEFGFADVTFSPDLLDSLKAAGYTGGRLHWQARDLVDAVTHMIDTGAVAYMSWIIDELTKRDMAICLQYDCLGKAEPDSMNAIAKSKYFTTWDQLCRAFRDKSHLLAMCPVIEFHGWQYLRDQFTETRNDAYRERMWDSTSWFYNECTKIFREYNPTRIMSYKPWGSAKKMEFETLAFPFEGNHPDPDSGYYVASGSGAYGMGDWSDYGIWSEYTLDDLKWQTMTAGKGKPEMGIHHAVQWREQTGIQFWVDHWEPAYWKRPGEWTDRQNLEYADFFLDTLQALGVASSGPQTRRFWDNSNNRFMNDPFTQDFLGITARHCWQGALVFPPLTGTMMDKEQDAPDISINPNPARNLLSVAFPPGDGDELTTICIRDLSGRCVYQLQQNFCNLNIDVSHFRSGIYLLVVETNSCRLTKKLVILKP